MRVERSVAPKPPHPNATAKLQLILAGTLICVVVLLIAGKAGVPASVLATAAAVWSASCTLLAAWKP